ncbi:FmdB family zinc ribbon protein [Calderihabitans maritimus]|uniref:Putative regulatory protein FmdB zinc ribbon domain-containing protein n=1 Tax=Calderihabitans maritimus TaxID=1246530 RepID=A0A1Z5HVF6_9FIRM|nr:zinc ribbon domain-containing protein [Calderihabitans maritimus]GAW93378.1 hypothetical protein Moth_0206 [Calderihabitans maritimus]
MPTYDYRCQKCGVFEYTQNITEPALEKCPHCGQEVKRLISRNVNVLYKAGGFHITDYRSKDYKEQAKKEEKSSSDAKAS